MSTTVRSSPSTSISTNATSTSASSISHRSQPRHPQLASFAQPTHPTILVPYESLLYSLPCTSLHYTAHIHLHSVTVTLSARYHQVAAFTTDAILAIPLPDRALVTHCSVEVTEPHSQTEAAPRVRRIETTVLSRTEAETVMDQLHTTSKTRQELSIDPLTSSHPLPTGRLPPLSYSQPTAGLFRLPLSALVSDCYVSVECRWEVSLSYVLGCYTLCVPLSNVVVGSGGSGSGCDVSVVVRLVGMGEEVRYNCTSHELNVNRIEQQGGEIELQMKQTLPAAATATQSTTTPDAPTTEKVVSKDFQLTYSYTTDHLQYTAIKLPPLTSPATPATTAATVDSDGSVLIHVCPPAVESLTTFFSRHYVFILDRSCSLAHHQLFTQLVSALSVSLTNLKPADTFTLLVYDTTHTAYTNELLTANPATVAAAISWLKGQSPRPRRRNGKGEDGAVDARGAIESGVRMLESVTRGDENAIGYLVLATDGASAVDRTVVDWFTTHQQQQLTERGGRQQPGHGLRVLALGIGRWVNMLWLRRLAEVGAGVCRWVSDSERVYGAMVELVQSCSVPVVVDLRVEFKDMSGGSKRVISPTATDSSSPSSSIRLYPNPPPDLYLNRPLTLHAAYNTNNLSNPPTHVILHGRTPDADWHQTIRIQQPPKQQQPEGSLALGGWRERLDVMCGRAWAEADGEAIAAEQGCIDVSVRTGLLCSHTRMIAYETSRKPTAVGDGAFDVKDVAGGAVLLSGNVLSEGSVQGTIDGTSGVDDGSDDISSGCCGWRDWEWHECLQC